MFLTKKALYLPYLILVFLFIPVFLGATNINETITLKKDGSGSINISYIEKESIVKEKNYLIGNLPFNKEKIDEFFKSAGIVIYSSKIENNEKDKSLIQVTLVMGFTSIEKLNDVKALANSRFSSTKTDSGTVIRNIISPEFIKKNTITQIYYVLKSEVKVKSSNGKIEDKNVTWFRGKEYLDGKSDVNFVCTFDDGKVTITKSKDEGEKGKSCGLFGLELPVLLFGGLIISGIIKRKKTDK